MGKIGNMFVVACALAGFLASVSEVWGMDSNVLNPGQRSIVAIAAFTANGDLTRLKDALNEGLDAGLTVSEIKEVLVQMYNGIHAFMAVMDERKAQGIADREGREPGPVPAGWNRDEYGARTRAKLAGSDVIPAPSGYQLFAPVIDVFLKEHLFADIFVRDNLDHQSRELATISALSSIPGLGGQLRFHMGAAMNTGLSEAQMKDFIAVLTERLGRETAAPAEAVLAQVLADRAK